MSSAAGGGPHPAPPPPRAQRPRRGDRSSCASRASRTAAPASAAWTGTCVFVEGAFPGERVRAEVTAPSATTRTRARSRCSSRAPTGCRSAATTAASLPGLALAGAALRAPARAASTSWSAMRCAGSGASRDSSSSRSSPARTRGATATRWSTRSATSEDGTLALGFHRRGRWDVVDDARDCMLASERNNAVRNLVRDWCRAARAGRHGPAHPGGASCATSSCARAGAPASCRCAS